MHMCGTQHLCGGQKTNLGCQYSHLSPSIQTFWQHQTIKSLNLGALPVSASHVPLAQQLLCFKCTWLILITNTIRQVILVAHCSNEETEPMTHKFA